MFELEETFKGRLIQLQIQCYLKVIMLTQQENRIWIQVLTMREKGAWNTVEDYHHLANIRNDSHQFMGYGKEDNSS